MPTLAIQPRRAARALCLLGCIAPLTAGCCWLRGHTTPADITDWQDPTPPRLSLAARAALYQERLERRHLSPEGVLIYRLELTKPQPGTYGNLSDGPFHTGIYLSSQAHRYAATRDPAAREQLLRALSGLRALMEVTGKRGLLARYLSLARDLPVPAGAMAPGAAAATEPVTFQVTNDPWVLSSRLPGYAWRADVSKDQYAGFIHGLGVTLAIVDDREIKAQAVELAAAAADHLLEHHLQIVDIDGRTTSHGSLDDRIAFVPAGVNALIALAIARVAAACAAGGPAAALYDRLVDDGFVESAYWAHFTVLGVGNRVNDNMAYLALYPLFLLEQRKPLLEDLWAGEMRTWAAVQDDRNAFFALAHAAMERRAVQFRIAAAPADELAGQRGREWLLEFPEEKVSWPVDLTRPGFDFPRAFFNNRKCEPRTTHGVPLHLRPRGSNLWVSDPFRLVGNLTKHGDEEYAGADYLLAYWIGRYHGFIAPED